MNFGTLPRRTRQRAEHNSRSGTWLDLWIDSECGREHEALSSISRKLEPGFSTIAKGNNAHVNHYQPPLR